MVRCFKGCFGFLSPQPKYVASAEKRIGHVNVTGRFHQLPRRIEDDYDITDDVLGSGCSGVVFMASNKLCGGKFAVKSFLLGGITEEQKTELTNEAEISLSIVHPHICRLWDVYEADDELNLVTECCEGGELLDRVNSMRKCAEADAAELMHQMLLATNHLHSHNIVHRDMKLENFLFESEECKFLKLIDFGFSKFWDRNTKMQKSCGTLAYVAPEVIAGSYTSQCDMWSLGVIVFILLVGYMPFRGASDRQTASLIEMGRYRIDEPRWSKVSKDGFDFVKKLLVVKPEKRLTCVQALKHRWMKLRATAGGFNEDTHRIVDDLRSFSQESKFRRSCLRLMSWSLTRADRGKLRDAFISFDKAGTGTISLADFQQLLRDNLDTSTTECEHIFEALDSNGDSQIDYGDFLAAMLCSRIRKRHYLLKAAFRRFDTDGTGYITRENLASVLDSSVDVDEVMNEIDENHDGKVSQEEFSRYITNDSSHPEHKEAVSEITDDHSDRKLPSQFPFFRFKGNQ
eukprot:TRINITY_DN55276_c0_g1_i1.p1 TRINITY_DN55276_c0_g1~~TRINITY_DN55276_c0_g1_i1.p1  ORF type:complete len:534 (-),score=88.36 TRINITY_DN55276_c0_g1_i1:53-1597(-)